MGEYDEKYGIWKFCKKKTKKKTTKYLQTYFSNVGSGDPAHSQSKFPVLAMFLPPSKEKTPFRKKTSKKIVDIKLQFSWI